LALLHAYSSNGIRGIINLPVSINTDAKVLVIAPPDQVEKALQSGAHIAGGAELIPDIISGKIKFNRCISTPQMMPILTKVARFLGPLGLMPTIKSGISKSLY
jgi:large subunit ribosomal protein L1